MDPLTHGLLGGVTAQVLFRKKVTPALTVTGALAAMAPDLDFLIHSRADPMLFFEYHRNFTHSLAFIPVGGFLIGLLLWLLWSRKPPLREMLLAATAGYATHGLLDACTSYGTMLLWPFSTRRISWDLIFILDPIYSCILLLGFWISLKRRLGNAAILSLVLATLYLGLGAFQHHRALYWQQELATQRGQVPERYRVIPAPGPFLLWRSLYLSQGRLYVDALRTAYTGAGTYWVGGSLPEFQDQKLEAEAPENSTLGRDLKIFRWFTEGYVALLQERPLELGDLRYSALPDGLQPLWGLRVDPENPDQHPRRLRFPWRESGRFQRLWKLLQNQALGGENLSQDSLNKRLKGKASEAMLGSSI